MTDNTPRKTSLTPDEYTAGILAAIPRPDTPPKQRAAAVASSGAWAGRTRDNATGQTYMQTHCIIPDPNQVREHFDEDALEHFAANIKANGIKQPISLRWDQELGKHIIIAGERRWRAAKLAGLTKVPATFHNDEDLTEDKIIELQLIENCHREDLQPMEVAKAFDKLMKLKNWDAQRLAAALHMSKSKVTKTLALLKLPSDIQSQVAAGTLASTSAYHLSRIKDPTAQRQLAHQAAAGQLTRNQVDKAARQRKGKPLQARGTTRSFFADDGWKVVVTSKKKGTYHDLERALRQALEEVRICIANHVELS